MNVVSDSPLLVLAAAGASTQAAPASGNAGDGQAFARLLQSEKSGSALTGGQSTLRVGESLPAGGNRLPPAGASRPLPSGTSSLPAPTTPAAPGGRALRSAVASTGSLFLPGADATAATQAAGIDALTGLPEADIAALAAEGMRHLTSDSPLAEVAGAKARLPRFLPDPSLGGVSKEGAAGVGLTGFGATPDGAAGMLRLQALGSGQAAVPAAASGAAGPGARQAAMVTPLQLPARGGGQPGDVVTTSLTADPDGGVLMRSGLPTPDALASDPGASPAALQGPDTASRRGSADEGLRQLLAGVSLDRAGGAQRLEQAMTAQAAPSASNDTDVALLAAAPQRGGDDARQGGRATDVAALIAGAGASAQPLTGQDQPARPAQLLNLLAAPSDPEFAPEFAGRLQMMVKNGVREASVQLHPAELGRLQLTVSTDGDQARIVIVAETAAARDMIEQSMPRLRDMLEQSGLQLAQGDVSQRQHNLSDGSSSGTVPGNLGDPAAEAEAAAGAGISLAASDRLLDAYV